VGQREKYAEASARVQPIAGLDLSISSIPILIPFLKAKEFYRFDLRAEHDPWLESGNGAALRTWLAGPIGIAASFGSGEDESPPSAANAEVFRAHARPQPSSHAALSDLRLPMQSDCLGHLLARSGKRGCADG
jgi:hypothetical protein